MCRVLYESDGYPRCWKLVRGICMVGSVESSSGWSNKRRIIINKILLLMGGLLHLVLAFDES